MQLNYLHYSPNLARVKAPRGNLEVGLSSQSEKEVANALSVELIANLHYSPKLAGVKAAKGNLEVGLCSQSQK
jgi:hypothetical protein